MQYCKPSLTPVDTCAKLSYDGPPVDDSSQYRSLAGALLCLTFTQSDIAFAVQRVCLFMHDPRTSHLLAIKCILRYLSGTLIMVFCFVPPRRHLLWSTPTLIGLVVPPSIDLPSGMLCSLVTIWSPSPQNDNTLSLDQVLRQSIGLSPMVSLKLVGSASYCRNFTRLSSVPLLSIVTMSVRSTSPRTRFSISVRSMLRLISTSYVSTSPSVMYVFCMSLQRFSLLTFSQKVSLLRCSWISDTI
jgi:hypothetical protein